MTTSTPSSSSLLPAVGTHGCYSVGSDRYPCTVVSVSQSGHRIVCEDDDYRVVSGSEQTGDVVYEYTRREGGSQTVYTRRRNGTYRAVGCETTGRLTLGVWAAYQDPSY